MPVSLCEPTTADEVRKNNRKVRDRLRARFREQVCLMKDLDLDNTTLAPPPNDSAVAKFQQPVAPFVLVLDDDRPIFPFLTVKKIIFIVAAFYKITPVELVSRRREIRVLRPRQIVAYLAKELTPFSLPRIGQCLGNRDHTTIMHAVRKMAILMKEDEELTDTVNHLREVLEFESYRNQGLSGASSSAP